MKYLFAAQKNHVLLQKFLSLILSCFLPILKVQNERMQEEISVNEPDEPSNILSAGK